MNRPPVKFRLSVSLDYGHEQTVALDVGSDIIAPLLQSVEVSSDPFSRMLASPGLMGGRGNAIDIKREMDEKRRAAARHIVGMLVERLIEDVFAKKDVCDGYTKDEWSPRQYRNADTVIPKGDG